VRQAQHLDQIGQRALAAVVLPIGIRNEAGRRIEGEILGDRGLPGRTERSAQLVAIVRQECPGMTQQHRPIVKEVALFRWCRI
jgi:hypothetical protein